MEDVKTDYLYARMMSRKFLVAQLRNHVETIDSMKELRAATKSLEYIVFYDRAIVLAERDMKSSLIALAND